MGVSKKQWEDDQEWESHRRMQDNEHEEDYWTDYQQEQWEWEQRKKHRGHHDGEAGSMEYVSE